MSVTSVQCSSPHSAIKNCAHKQIYNFGLNLIYFHVCFLLDNRNSSHTDTIIRSYRNWMISKSNYTEILIYFLSAQAKNSDISVFLSLSPSRLQRTKWRKKKNGKLIHNIRFVSRWIVVAESAQEVFISFNIFIVAASNPNP